MKLTDVPTRLIVASGKGGVGKTTVSADIACTARDMGLTVGLIDADISTPNSPQVVGGEDVDLEGQRLSDHDSLVPPVVNDIQLISQGVVLPDDVPVLRDGTWRAEAVADYIEFVRWADDTDLVVIDTPPGTGEELQVVATAAEPTHAVVVTTPHPSSVRDATKTHEFFEQADIPHTGVVNMAYIPGGDVADHAMGGTELETVQGVGESIATSVKELVQDTASDLPLFGYDPSIADPIDMEFVAVLPYTTDDDSRRLELEGLVADIVADEEVVA